MRLTITRKVLVLIAVPLVFQGTFVALLAWSQRRHAEASDESIRSREVVADANLVLRLLIDAETGIRGYAVTDDPGFIDPYTRARQALPERLHRLRELTHDDVEEDVRAARIEAEARSALEWLTITEKMIQDRGGKPETMRIRHDPASQRIRDGKAIMDELRGEIGEFLDVENRNVAEQSRLLERSQLWIRGLLVGGFLTTFLLTACLTAYFWRQIGRRFHVLAANTERLAAGKELLTPLDGGDELADLDRAFHEMAGQLVRSTEKLRQTAEEVRDLYNRAPCGYQSLAADGTIIAINDTELQWLQYSREELVGRTKFPDLMTEASRQLFVETFPQFKERGLVKNIEYELVRKDGSVFPVLLNATAIRDEAGGYISSRATLFDVAERKRAEDLLRKSTERLRRFVESATDYSLIILDPSGLVATWNAGAERITAYRAHEIIGKHFSCFFPPEAVERAWPDEELRQATTAGRFEDEGWRVRKDGSRFWANVVITALRNPAGEIEGFSKITRDLTERKAAEEEIRNLNRELEERVRLRTADLEEANRELLQKNQENEMFVYSVSHDLRSPLVNLQGFSKELDKGRDALQAMFADERVPAEIREPGQALLAGKVAKSLGFIQSAVMRLSGIIDALLRLSRAGRLDYRRQRVDVAELVSQILSSLHGTIAEKQVTVQKNELPPAWGDPTAVEQVFANLIGNALNYLDPKRPGHIEIGCRPAGEADSAAGFTTYYVKDNGLGIPAAHQHKIFQVFQRVHPGAAKGEGIGLAIVSRIVERHRGRVWVESQEGAGSTFFVNLPAQAV